MSDSAGDKSRTVALVSSVDGIAASDDGEQIKLGVTLNGAVPVEALFSPDQGINLIVLMSAALAKAARRRTGNSSLAYTLHTDRVRAYETDSPQTVILSFRLAEGLELALAVERIEIARLRETLSDALGGAQTGLSPGSRTH